MGRSPIDKELRERILERDNYRCQECNSTSLDIHHIDGKADNNDPSNLISLCHSCHREKHRGKEQTYIGKNVEDKQVVSVSFPVSTVKAIEKFTKWEGCTLSEGFREIVQKYLSQRKKEIRVFLGKAESEWLDKLVEDGDLGSTPSEVIRTILRDVRRGVLKR